MKITLNAIEFDVTAVATPLRTAVLTDDAIRPGLLRDVATWRRAGEEGKTYGPVTQNGETILPNGVLFYVPKAGGVEKADGPSKKMATRFLEAIGGKSINDLQQAIHGLFGMVAQKMPLKDFSPLNPVADWNLRMGTDFAVLRISNAARNLSAFVLLPAQVGFGAVVIEKGEGFEAFEAENAELIKRQPGYVIAPRTEAATLARRIALQARVQDLAAALEGQNTADLPLTDPRVAESSRLAFEWSLLFPKAQTRRSA